MHPAVHPAVHLAVHPAVHSAVHPAVHSAVQDVSASVRPHTQVAARLCMQSDATGPRRCGARFSSDWNEETWTLRENQTDQPSRLPLMLTDGACGACGAVDTRRAQRGERQEVRKAAGNQNELVRALRNDAYLSAFPAPGVPAFAVRERIAYIHTDQRFYNAATGVLHVPVGLPNCIGFELVEAAVVRTHYSIESPHDVLTVRVASDTAGTDVRTYALTIPTRDYTATQLKDALNTLLSASTSSTNAASTGSTHVAVTVDADTKKFKVTATTLTYCALEFGDKHLAYLLGFARASSYTGPTDADGTDRFESVDLLAKFYPVRAASAVTTVVYALSDTGAGGMPSPGQFDLSGSRYLRLACLQLEHAYSNSGIIKDLPFADDVTFTTQVNPSFSRRFVNVLDLGRLQITLQVLLPDATAVAYNNYGLSFHATFAVTTLLRTRDQSTDCFVD